MTFLPFFLTRRAAISCWCNRGACQSGSAEHQRARFNPNLVESNLRSDTQATNRFGHAEGVPVESRDVTNTLVARMSAPLLRFRHSETVRGGARVRFDTLPLWIATNVPQSSKVDGKPRRRLHASRSRCQRDGVGAVELARES